MVEGSTLLLHAPLLGPKKGCYSSQQGLRHTSMYVPAVAWFGTPSCSSPTTCIITLLHFPLVHTDSTPSSFPCPLFQPHPLNPEDGGSKVPQNISILQLHCTMLEPELYL